MIYSQIVEVNPSVKRSENMICFIFLQIIHTNSNNRFSIPSCPLINLNFIKSNISCLCVKVKIDLFISKNSKRFLLTRLIVSCQISNTQLNS